MNLADIVVIIIIGMALLLALRQIVKNRKEGKCCSCGTGNCQCCEKDIHK